MTALHHLERYVMSLPRGLDSFPEQGVRGSLVRTLLGADDTWRVHAPLLPAPLRALVENPPGMTSWVHTPVANALQEARRDLLFSTDEAFLEDVELRNRRLLAGDAYGVMFKGLGARRLLEGAAARWAQLHRGVAFTVDVEQRSPRATAMLLFPENLYSALACRRVAAATRAAMVVAGDAMASVTVETVTPRRAEMVCTW